MRYPILTFLSCIFILSNINAQGLSFSERQVGDAKIIVCKNNSNKDFEVSLTYSCTGHTANYASPVKQTITAYSEIEVLILTPIKGVSGSCQMNYTYTEIRKSRAKESPAYNYDGITVFGKNHCPRCDYFITELRNKNVVFQELNIDTYQADNDLMWDKLKEAGFSGNSITTPVVISNNKVYYNVQDLDALLGKLKNN